MESKVAPFTVRGIVLPEMLPNVAVITAAPVWTPMARPLSFTVATPVSEELQVTNVVMS